MKFTTLYILLLLALLTACQSATPLPPLTAAPGSKFTLAPEQSASITGTGLTVRLVSVSGDQRCPIGMECVMSGPVTMTISIQKDSASPAKFVLQTFTDNDGSAPKGSFEGIKNRVEYKGYIIQVKEVLPYPAKAVNKIGDSEYRVSFLATANNKHLDRRSH